MIRGDSAPILVDAFGRQLNYLRLSITDDCDLNCTYCRPKVCAGNSVKAGEILKDGEICVLARIFIGLGIYRVRITGGEPLLRPDLASLVEKLAGSPGISDLALSTNGIRLAGVAANLKRSGLGRVNISLDTLKSDRFLALTGREALADVLSGVDAALNEGLKPVKLNCVVVRGVNEDEIADFVRLTVERAIHVRFIELMPMGETGFFSEQRRVPLGEMINRAGAMESVGESGRPKGGGPANYYRYHGGKGTIGFIGALSSPFCGSCNRLRLTSRGVLLSCLDSAKGVDLGAALRAGAGPEEIAVLIQDAVARKPKSHAMLERLTGGTRSETGLMCQIGG